MGYWTTLHLFDYKTFYNERVPVLKGEKGSLEEDCLEFLKLYTTCGIAHFSESKVSALIRQNIETINRISNSFDTSFKVHREFHKIKNHNDRSLYLSQLEGYSDFGRFMEYYIFKTCADFFPHIPLGKGGVMRNFTINFKTLSYSIIGEFDSRNEFFCDDMMGVSNWISSEDVELLYLDKENLHFEDNGRADAFLTLLDIAYKNGLGLVMGIDMREDRLELLPSYKLISSAGWENINKTGLLFRR
ncbi:hypothetical protein [Runella sp.]|uniref:hypothetical protein n=1 Tax=Runella sp. TaxID=1960881 RepID=UPI003D0B8553